MCITVQIMLICLLTATATLILFVAIIFNFSGTMTGQTFKRNSCPYSGGVFYHSESQSALEI